MNFDDVWAELVGVLLTSGSATTQRVLRHPASHHTIRENLRRQFEASGLVDAGAAFDAPTRPAPVIVDDDFGEVELWTKAKRTRANLEAMNLLAAAKGPLSRQERAVVARYSGWGGLSIEDNLDAFPEGFPKPEARGLIHEYYTPAKVTMEIARILRPVLHELPRVDGAVQTLEPSAGIGRFIRAFTDPAYNVLKWHVIELSKVSARMLRAIRPDLDVFEGSFEQWVVKNHHLLNGKLGLVLSNPPYGVRGALGHADPDAAYYEKQAYAYFIRRSADMLARDGIGVYLVPSGFMTGATRLRGMREQVLKKHHLVGAFRLPSKLFPGAQLVTDLIFLRSRGGTLAKVPKSDQFILDGHYFRDNPHNILGIEVGRGDADDEDQTAKPRWGYQVEGEFDALPALDFHERQMVYAEGGAAVPGKKLKGPSRVMRTNDEIMGEGMGPDAKRLGRRVADYFEAIALQNERSVSASASRGELVRDLVEWVRAHGEPGAMLADQSDPDIETFLQAFEGKNVSSTILSSPVIEHRFVGRADNLAHVLDHVYVPHGDGVPLSDLVEHVSRLGGYKPDTARGIVANQVAKIVESGHWCIDGATWDRLVHQRDYYSGSLWGKLDRATAAVEDPDTLSEVLYEGMLHGIVPATALGAQARKLREALKPAALDQIVRTEDGSALLHPVQSWIPLSIIQAWAIEDSGLPLQFSRDSAGMLYVQENGGSPPDRWALFAAWANHDDAIFDPKKEVAGKDKSSKEVKLDKAEAQLAFIGENTDRFVAWLERPESESWARMLEDVYNRKFRGFVPPIFASEPPDIARWTGSVVLKPHQAAGANRVLHYRRGLLAFDVGVGKTFTGVATLAKARQEGWARRPIVLVPNTLVWGWHRSITWALPDYRIGVIGSDRVEREITTRDMTVMLTSDDYGALTAAYLERFGKKRKAAAALISMLPFEETTVPALHALLVGRMLPGLPESEALIANNTRVNTLLEQLAEGGVVTLTPPAGKLYRFVKDDATSRGEKWRAFQAGRFDAMIVPYSMMNRTELSEDAVKAYVAKNTAIMRHIQIATDKQQAKTAGEGGKGKRRKAQVTERDRAIQAEVQEAWVVSKLKLGKDQRYDEGVTWDTIGCDLLIIDEAQNFKNLYMPENRQGGTPAFMGSGTDGANRAWQLDFRCASIHARTGGTGVVLLSATPAKNSPLEYYSLMQYVDHQIWYDAGIYDPEQFITRYLDVRPATIVNTKMNIEEKPAVVGFLNVPELRDLVFRYAEFKTAEDVGLKLPDVTANQLQIRMDERQNDLYDEIVPMLEAAVENPFDAEPGAILKYLSRLSLIAVHPDLPQAVEDEPDDAARISNPDDSDSDSGEGSGAWDALDSDVIVPFQAGGATLGAFIGEGESASASDEPKKKTRKRVKPRTTIADPWSSKFRELVRRIMLRPTCGHIVFVENISAHYWIKECLVQSGFPEDRIAMLNGVEAKDASKRTRIADLFNGPPTEDLDAAGMRIRGPAAYDVVLCNAVAYEGIDLQVRTCAIHHIDLPWEPATIQQRNGRGVRQGNELGDIEINYYLCRRSTDGVRFSKIMGKRGWMTQFLKSQDRSTNNPAASGGMSAEDMAVMISRDPARARVTIRKSVRKALLKKRGQVAAKATSMLRAAANQLNQARHTGDPENALRLRERAEIMLGNLERVDPEAWPYASLVRAFIEKPSRTVEIDYSIDERRRGDASADRVGVIKAGLPLVDGHFYAIKRRVEENRVLVLRDVVYEVAVGSVFAFLRAVGTHEWEQVDGSERGLRWNTLIRDHAMHVVEATIAEDPPIDMDESIDDGPEVITLSSADVSENRGEEDTELEDESEVVAKKGMAPLPATLPLPVARPLGDVDPLWTSNAVYGSDRWFELCWAKAQRDEQMRMEMIQNLGSGQKAVMQPDGSVALAPIIERSGYSYREVRSVNLTGAIPPTNEGWEQFKNGYMLASDDVVPGLDSFLRRYWRERKTPPRRRRVFRFDGFDAASLPDKLDVMGGKMSFSHVRITPPTGSAPAELAALWSKGGKSYGYPQIRVAGIGRETDAKFTVTYRTEHGDPGQVIADFGASKATGLAMKLKGLAKMDGK